MTTEISKMILKFSMTLVTAKLKFKVFYIELRSALEERDLMVYDKNC